MITDTYKGLYWKTNLSTFLGFAPGRIVVVDHQYGGGFAGEPEVVIIAPIESIPLGQPTPVPYELSTPHSSLEYRVGGRSFSGYNYFKPNLAKELR